MEGLRHLYLHGFGSNRLSTKGVHLRKELAPAGVRLELLDLNVPTFSTQTYTEILRHLDSLDEQTPSGTSLFLAGSSMGGYLAGRWAELHPDRVAGLFLLCPGFDLSARWPLLLGEAAFAEWEKTGSTEVENGIGGKRPLHWEFVIDSRTHPAFPEVLCPTTIVHGRQDEVVPIDLSRRYAGERDHVELIEVDDDHLLHGSLERITAKLREALARTSPP